GGAGAGRPETGRPGGRARTGGTDMTIRLINGAEMLSPCGDPPASPPHQDEDLPVNPFVALRVAYGMLLGEEDFRALMGNPRGKQMLHSAWLHGWGVVWGYDVVKDGVRNLKIGPGLAVDGLGRELLHEATTCLDVRDLVKATDTDDDDCSSRTIEACLVGEFDSC